MAPVTHDYDPRGLIRESYRIENITAPECRAIFLDWAMGRPEAPDESAQITALLDFYGADKADHPMTEVLRAGLAGAAAPQGRRGGRSARVG